jgi:hypothetical protein
MVKGFYCEVKILYTGSAGMVKGPCKSGCSANILKIVLATVKGIHRRLNGIARKVKSSLFFKDRFEDQNKNDTPDAHY